MERASRRPVRRAAVAVSVVLFTAGTVTASALPEEARTQNTEPAAEAPAPFGDAEAVTADGDGLRTWWHDNHDVNGETPVADDDVRMSPFYSVKVATDDAPDAQFDSYTYMSLPRSGDEKIGYEDDDGAEFADEADLTMSWSSFEYETDAWVDVQLQTGQEIESVDEVTVRPESVELEKELVDPSTVRIKVPHSEDGHRFSVEFDPQLVTSYNDMEGDTGNLTTEEEGNRAIHTEPQNSMMVFADPAPTGDDRERLEPGEDDGSIHYPDEGQVRDLNEVEEEILYFGPGTYHMGSDYHAMLPEQVKWIHLAPGAYVKGAFEFVSDAQDLYRVTGQGVLSGEQYVYEADTREDYDHRTENPECHAECVKMLEFTSKDDPQHLDLQGVTINEPPYHSFVVYGNEETFTMRVEDYKQVGAWYWQTDGIELYEGSTMENTFFNANDDVLKLYHSDISIENTVVWKSENGPVVQWGWGPREIDGVEVTDTHVIHNRMYWKDVKHNTCVLNSSSHWEDMDSTETGDPGTTVANLRFENITVEGTTNCALRLHALSNTENIEISGLSIDGWNDLDPASQVSRLETYSDEAGQEVTLGNETQERNGIRLEDYSVGGEAVDRSGDNWSAEEAGRLDFDEEHWDSWDAGQDLGHAHDTSEAAVPPQWIGGLGLIVLAAAALGGGWFLRRRRARAAA